MPVGWPLNSFYWIWSTRANSLLRMLAGSMLDQLPQRLGQECAQASGQSLLMALPENALIDGGKTVQQKHAREQQAIFDQG